ncbi:MAG: MurR/RpiR family transcriptional regulator [Rubrivivax sp.]|nr:MurR/RpiR family transcriptional regulator [Rubrivivax sp.]MDP3084489.1 MurR/RpiR family transcriptional regulator [Rubrivivax sp.]
MTPTAVSQLIDHTFDSLSPELQRAARWLQQHHTALALHSMRNSARQAGVSPATMTRLAQRLGFEGYEALRQPFMKQLGGHLPDAAPVQAGPAAELGAASQLNALQQANVASVLALNPPERLQAAADAMLKARNVYFLGMRVCHGVAFHMHYVYGLLGANGVLINDLGGTMADQITRLERDDVLVAISQAPYTRQTVEGVQLALDQFATVVAMTDSALSPIARRAAHVLMFETATSSFFQSTLGAEALAEALVATLAVRGGVNAQRRLRQMQEHLRRTRAYWERPAPSRQSRGPAASRALEILQ